VSFRPTQVAIEFGKLRIGETVIYDPFRIGMTESGIKQIQLRILSDQYPPKSLELNLQSEVRISRLTNDEFLDRLHDAAEKSEQDDETDENEDE
jgi:hypothetical protein